MRSGSEFPKRESRVGNSEVPGQFTRGIFPNKAAGETSYIQGRERRPGESSLVARPVIGSPVEAVARAVSAIGAIFRPH